MCLQGKVLHSDKNVPLFSYTVKNEPQKNNKEQQGQNPKHCLYSDDLDLSSATFSLTSQVSSIGTF